MFEYLVMDNQALCWENALLDLTPNLCLPVTSTHVFYAFRLNFRPKAKLLPSPDGFGSPIGQSLLYVYVFPSISNQRRFAAGVNLVRHTLIEIVLNRITRLKLYPVDNED